MFTRLFRSLATPSNLLEVLEPRSLLSADLAVSVGTLRQGIDRNNNPTLTLPVTVVNLGNAALNGGGAIDYYLSADRILDDNDFRFASTNMPTVRGARSSGTVTLNTITPAIVAPRVGRAAPPGEYFIIARLYTNRGAETNLRNNEAATTTTISLTYQFGQVGEKSNVPLAVTMPDGTLVNFSLRGVGTGQVINVDNEVFVIVNGSTTQSSLSITPMNQSQSAKIDTLTINGGLKDLSAKRLTVDGNLTIRGAVGDVVLGNLYHSNFQINGFGVDVGISIGQVADSSITSQIPIRALSVDRWRDTDLVVDTITTPYIGDLTSGGDFDAGVTLATSNGGFAIEQVQVGGRISGLWLVNGNVAAMNVGSIAISFNATIRGDVDSIFVHGNAGGIMGASNFRRIIVEGNLDGALYLAGADLGSNGDVDGTDSGDDTFGFGRFGLVEVRGVMSSSLLAAGFSSSDSQVGNDDDQLEPNSFIETIIVYHGMNNSHFAAANLPTMATINFVQIATAGNPNFVTGQ